MVIKGMLLSSHNCRGRHSHSHHNHRWNSFTCSEHCSVLLCLGACVCDKYRSTCVRKTEVWERVRAGERPRDLVDGCLNSLVLSLRFTLRWRWVIIIWWTRWFCMYWFKSRRSTMTKMKTKTKNCWSYAIAMVLNIIGIQTETTITTENQHQRRRRRRE